jgi:hypothetical protein
MSCKCPRRAVHVPCSVAALRCVAVLCCSHGSLPLIVASSLTESSLATLANIAEDEGDSLDSESMGRPLAALVRHCTSSLQLIRISALL